MSSLPLDMDLPFALGDVVLRMTLAALFGGAVGWDREVQNKAAGLRTHMMVALGAAAFTLAALEMMQLATSESGGHSDPMRVVDGIVGGIGFLGAGQIIQSGGTVQGVTTAAGIWVVGAIGVACGGGYYALAGLTALFSLVILSGVNAIERFIRAPKRRKE